MELTNWQKAIIDEINDVLHDNFEDYETGIELSDKIKLKIANDMLNFEYQFWEDIRMIIMNYIKANLTKKQLKMLGDE